MLKLDAGTERMRQLINKNNDLGCSWDELLSNLIAFGNADGSTAEGNKAIIQTLLFDGTSDGTPVSNIIPEEFYPYLEHLKKIRPRYVMLYALDRATPEKQLRKLPVDELEQYAQIIENEGIDVKVYS